MNKTHKTRLDRRGFLKAAAGAAVVPAIVPSSVFGKDGAVPPSERVVAGAIGIHRRGMADMRALLPLKDVQFVAICDVVADHSKRVKSMVDQRYKNSDCKMYSDTQAFLAERTDIDAILSATGDHNHALVSIWTMRSGKDIYTEKPSCMTIAEGRAVVDTARRYGRVYQTGTQRLSQGAFVFAIEMAMTGRLGKVHTSYAHIAPWDAAEMKHDWKPGQTEPPKDQVDWDAWLGACPWRPYNKSYVSGGWRGYYDFHTSCIGEWGAHTFAQAQAGIDKLDTSPVHYGYVKNTTGDGMVTTFADGKKMILSRGKKWWRGSCGMRFDGDEGWTAVADGYSKPDVSSPAMLADFKKLVDAYVARTQRPLNHMRNFIDCVKSRRRPVANEDVMYNSMVTVHCANICMWLKRDMKFDPKKGVFIGDDEANTFRSRAMREPWIY
jgi:hypothetical protein